MTLNRLAKEGVRAGKAGFGSAFSKDLRWRTGDQVLEPRASGLMNAKTRSTDILGPA